MTILKGGVFLLFTILSGLPAASQSPLAKNLDITRTIVVFIYARDAKGVEQQDGTGFLLAIPTKSDPTRTWIVLVTARHIADPAWLGCAPPNELVARFNKKTFDPSKDASGVFELSLSDRSWIYPTDESIDIAFTFLDGAKVDFPSFENKGLPFSQLPSASEAKAVEIGSPVSSAGLLPGIPASKRNYPIFKFGNVSSIPAEQIPVPGCGNTTRLMSEWLIAASLVAGNSGSPVVYSPMFLQPGRPFLLGVQSISVGNSDVAGMAPIRYLVDRIRELQSTADIDPSIPGDVVEVKPTTTSVPNRINGTTVPNAN